MLGVIRELWAVAVSTYHALYHLTTHRLSPRKAGDKGTGLPFCHRSFPPGCGPRRATPLFHAGQSLLVFLWVCLFDFFFFEINVKGFPFF